MLNKTNILVIFILFTIGCATVDIEKNDLFTDEAIPTVIDSKLETKIAKMQQPMSVASVEHINPRISEAIVTPSISTNANNKEITPSQNTGTNDNNKDIPPSQHSGTNAKNK